VQAEHAPSTPPVSAPPSAEWPDVELQPIIEPPTEIDTKIDTKVDTKVDTKIDTKVDTKIDTKIDLISVAIDRMPASKATCAPLPASRRPP
jgi:hypothetical protein